MSQTLLIGMIESLEKEKDFAEIPNNIAHDLFIVFIEMTQNIIKYSKNESDDKDKFKSSGLIIVGKNEDENYYIHSQNIIDKKDIEKIKDRIDEIKSLNETEIKKRYKELRRSAANLHNNGAGIGFYEIAKRALCLEYEFEKINENKFNFFFTVVVKS
eukprot:TRINITY_DN525363_c0_g1_i1.p1 TRINITY_DN525363_c0_g1~~TRINITY_DN525363_c0_g1_i1.p1  ORF type:complete len:158 (+),score=18.70 TRINITY_DN525363_c0_g1_i1:2-475(+)